jgi:hypothetical protein
VNNRLLIGTKKARRNYREKCDENFHVDELYLQSSVNQSLSLAKERSEKLIIISILKSRRKWITWVT